LKVNAHHYYFITSAGTIAPHVHSTLLRPGIMSLNYNVCSIMNVIRNSNDNNIGCTLFEVQLASIHSRRDVYEAAVISASMRSNYFASGGVFLQYD